MKHKFSIITSCLALALAGSANAGVFTALDWTNDSSLSFITSTNVTHSADFVVPAGSAASINGFTFEAVNLTGTFGTLANPYTGSNFTIDTTTSPNNFTFIGSAGVSGTASGLLSEGLVGFGAPGTGSVAFNLTGLLTDTDYEFYFFSPQWTDSPRTGFLDGSDDVGNTFAVNQSTGAGNKIIRYAYNTGASTSFTLTSTSTANMHNYAFVNTTVIPEPSTWALLALSLTAVTVIRRRRSSASLG